MCAVKVIKNSWLVKTADWNYYQNIPKTLPSPARLLKDFSNWKLELKSEYWNSILQSQGARVLFELHLRAVNEFIVHTGQTAIYIYICIRF